MNKVVKLCISSVVLFFVGCSTEKNDLAIKVLFDKTYAINAPAISCYNDYITPPDVMPSADIQPAYFQVQKFGINWPHTNRPFIIASLRFKFQHASFEGGIYKCELAGDQLLSLNKNWWKHGEAVIGGSERPSARGAENWTPPQLTQIDCAIKCGGLPSDNGYVSTGTVEIIGFHEESNMELTPNSAQTTVTIENLAY